MIKELKATGLALGLSGLLATSAFAGVDSQQQQRQRGGAAGIVAAVVNLAVGPLDLTDTNIQVGLVNIDKSLNNLTALNNVLNNSPILSDITVGDVSVLSDITIFDVVDITNVLNDLTITNVLNKNQITALNLFLLNNPTILLTDVIGVAVLTTGDLIILR